MNALLKSKLPLEEDQKDFVIDSSNSATKEQFNDRDYNLRMALNFSNSTSTNDQSDRIAENGKKSVTASKVKHENKNVAFGSSNTRFVRQHVP